MLHLYPRLGVIYQEPSPQCPSEQESETWGGEASCSRLQSQNRVEPEFNAGPRIPIPRLSPSLRSAARVFPGGGGAGLAQGPSSGPGRAWPHTVPTGLLQKQRVVRDGVGELQSASRCRLEQDPSDRRAGQCRSGCGSDSQSGPEGADPRGAEVPECHRPARLLASTSPPRWVPALPVLARLAEQALVAAGGAAERAQPGLGAYRESGPQVGPAAPHPRTGGSPLPIL